MAISENDIIIEEEDVKIEGGDFFVGDANTQNIKHILIAQPGQFIVAPSVGGMLYKFQNAPISDPRALFSSFQEELRKDGYSSINFYNRTEVLDKIKLSVEAKRVSSPKREVI